MEYNPHSPGSLPQVLQGNNPILMVKIILVLSGILLGCLSLPSSAPAAKPGYPVRVAWSVNRPLTAGAVEHATLIVSTARPIERIRVAPAEGTSAALLGPAPEYEGPLTPQEPLSFPVSFLVPDGESRGLAFEVQVDGPNGSYRLGACLDTRPETARALLRSGTPTALGESTLEAASIAGNPIPQRESAAAGDTVAFRGRFLYRDRLTGPTGFLNGLPEQDPVKPVRYAAIELLILGQTLPVATGLTDSTGAFSISIVPESQLTYRARVVSTTGAWGGSTFRVRTSSGGQFFSVTTPNQNGVVGDVDWGDMVIEPGAGEAFNLLDCCIEGARQVELLTGALPAPNLNVYWNDASTSGTYFRASQSSIYLLADEGYDDCVVLHEFGHFVAAQYSKDDSPGGEHFIDDDEQDVRLAWSEGFASYFQSSVRRRLGDSFASWYIDTWGTPGAGQLLFSYDLEGATLSGTGTPDNRTVFQGLYLRGPASEVVVQALLWDIEDDASVPGDEAPGSDDDALAEGTDPSWLVISGPLEIAAAVSVEDFWDGWFALALDRQSEMEATFGALGVEFFPDAFEEDAPPSDPPPLFSDGIPVRHTFYPIGDTDAHTLHLEASVPVLVETSNILGYGDTFLEVTHGDSVWSNEDRSPGEMASAVQFLPPVTGDYTVRIVRSALNPHSQMTTYGSYDLRAVIGAPVDVLFTSAPGGTAADPGLSTGAAFADADLDGRPDLYVVNNTACGTSKAKDAFYRNEGALAFTNQTQAAGFGSSEGGIAAAWGDFDRDGDPDLFVTDHGLYRNEGQGTFTDVTTGSAVTDVGREYDAAWVDTDTDGWLDLFVVRRDGPSVLWRNEHDGTFVDVTATTGLTFPADGASAIGCAWGDYDHDRLPDLFLARRSQDAQVLYRNAGGNQFEDVTVAAGLVSDIPASGGVWGDVSGDGRLDLFVASTGPDRLYVSNGDGTFTERAREFGVDVALFNTGAGLFDADLDGDLDLYASTYDGAQFLFWNLGSTMARAAQPSEIGLGYGMAAGDLDGDGDPELYQALGCEPSFCICQSNRLYQNHSTGRHWLGVKLLGDVSNLDGIGARLVLHGAGSVRQTREMGTGSGWASKSLLPVVFGLGDGTSVDSLEVFWPSGARNVVTDIEIDRVINVLENTPVPVDPPEPEAPFNLVLRGPMPNPFRGGTSLVLELTRAAHVEAVIYDLTGRRVRTLLDRELGAGTQYVGWNGTDDHGRRVGRGLYVYQVHAGGRTEMRKLFVIGE